MGEPCCVSATGAQTCSTGFTCGRTNAGRACEACGGKGQVCCGTGTMRTCTTGMCANTGMCP
jgi:hypothetical protein